MALLDKLKFWEKKEPAPDLPSTPFPGPDPLRPSQDVFGQKQDPFTQQDPFSQPPPNIKAPQSFEDLQKPAQKDPFDFSSGQAQRPSQAPTRDMELVQLKLDAIKNTLEAINLRLQRLEQAAGIDRQ